MAKSAKKILLVEDNDEIRELLALFMKHLGYKALRPNNIAQCSAPILIIED
jgi:DNA-binding response OmpR family regulator